MARARRHLRLADGRLTSAARSSIPARLSWSPVMMAEDGVRAVLMLRQYRPALGARYSGAPGGTRIDRTSPG